MKFYIGGFCYEVWPRVRFVAFEILTAAFMKASIFCLPPAFTVVSCSAYSSTLKMETICSSELSVEFQRTTSPYMLEDRTLTFQIC
jgi:hypothetical protein